MFSERTSDLLMDFTSFSKKNIDNLNQLGLFIEISWNNNKNDELEKIAFISKYISGLRSVMGKDVQISDEANDKIKNEFSDNISKLKSTIENYLSDTDAGLREMFNLKYMQLNQESFSSLLSLIEDLALYKEYTNRIKKGLSN